MTIGNQRLSLCGLKRPLCGGAILAAVAGCSSDGPTSVSAPPRDSLAVVPQELVLGVGMSRQLSATVLDQSGAPISSPAITFSSSNPDRVRVTPEGMATYVSAGPADIKASGEDLLASVPYTGLPSGHPLGTLTTSTRLPGDHQGDAPFGVAVAGDGRIFISQTNTGRVAADFFPVTGFSTRDLGGTPTSIALLAGGVALVTPSGPDANDASLIDLTSDRILADIPLDVPAFSAIAAPDSQTVYLGTNDGRVLEFDAASATITRTLDLEVVNSRANHLAINSSGTLLYASSFTTGTISEIDLRSLTVARLLIVGGEPQGVAISPDGSELFVADESGAGHINIYDIVGDTLETSLPSGATSSLGGAFGLAMSPDGAAVYVGVLTTQGPGLIQIIDTRTRTILRTINSCGMMPRRIAFGFSGGMAVITDETGCVNFLE